MTTKKIRNPKPKVKDKPARALMFAPGLAVGRPGPFPVKYDVPTNTGIRTATIWQYPWDLDVTGPMADAGIDTKLTLDGPAKIREQNIYSAILLIDKEKGWENLCRIDGSKIDYTVPSKDDEATQQDCRVMLAITAPGLFAVIKEESAKLQVCMTEDDVKNLKSLLAGTSKETESTPEN